MRGGQKDGSFDPFPHKLQISWIVQIIRVIRFDLGFQKLIFIF